MERARRWRIPEGGPTATGVQRARRRRLRGALSRALVFSPRPPGETLAAALVSEGFEIEWTDSGPGAVGEAVAGDLAVCVIDAGGREHELDYLPCLNQADPLLPVIVINDRDSLQMQRKIRSHKVFYYLLEPLDGNELREVLGAAVGREPSPEALPADPG